MSLEPRWIIPVGAGCSLGVTIDDGCYVILFPKYITNSTEPDSWKPVWIPPDIARFIGILAFLKTIEKRKRCASCGSSAHFINSEEALQML